MDAVNIHEAKTHLSRLVERVAAGEEIVIARSGKPVAKLVPFQEPREPRRWGSMRGVFEIPEGFDEPDLQIYQDFYGEHEGREWYEHDIKLRAELKRQKREQDKPVVVTGGDSADVVDVAGER
jgi:prevent-host-death family protein